MGRNIEPLQVFQQLQIHCLQIAYHLGISIVLSVCVGVGVGEICSH